MKDENLFEKFARKVAYIAGLPYTFLAAAGAVVLWAVSGPAFGFSDTWQLVINTSTTIITFLMVFIIQNTQNKDTMALQLKLDELIRAHSNAHNAIIDLEELNEGEIEKIRARYEELAKDARNKLRERSLNIEDEL